MRDYGKRLAIFVILIFALALACVVRLVDLQIVKGSEYATQTNRSLVRAYSITAPRGEIMDRNGKPLVKNRIGYVVQAQKVNIPQEELNKTLYSASKIVAEYGGVIESTFPVIMDEKTGKLGFDFFIEENGGTRKVEGVKPKSDYLPQTDEEEEETEEKPQEDKEEKERKNQERLEKWKKANKLTEYTSAQDILDYYKKKYSVSSEYTDKQAMTVTAMRYAMDKGGFSEDTPYTIARDVDKMVVQQIKEQFMDFPGISVEIEPVRVFSDKTMASHILGRTGKIYAEEYAEMKSQGYGMHDIIGKDGLEKLLEPYLKGTDGYKSVEMSRGGIVTQVMQSKEPQPGNYVKLTIDSDLQRVAERALKNTVERAVGSNGAGAVIAVNPKDGGVLAVASYPTYDLTRFNEDYDKLLKAKNKPLLNRVLHGTYSPGSTFKPLVSVAALETGVITPNTYIVDRGKYTYFDSYQPTCLVYSSTGATHGTINVSEAIGVSCNYFFYDVGQKMGIEAIDKYATAFGLGQNTGIELPEYTGVLASPENRKKAGGIWYPGDVLQASIGQSDNLFTPAQLASYVCTILNKGKRYSLHLVDEVLSYGDNRTVLKKEAEILDEIDMSEETYNAVINGMRRVVTQGTAAEPFATAKYKAAGKTGTAEVPDGADNVLFVGFAPYENPEIVIAVIIEHGANSAFPASVARAVFDAYMEIKEGKFESESEDAEEEDSLPAAAEAYIPTAGARNEEEGAEGKQPEASPEEDNSSQGSGTL